MENKGKDNDEIHGLHNSLLLPKKLNLASQGDILLMKIEKSLASTKNKSTKVTKKSSSYKSIRSSGYGNTTARMGKGQGPTMAAKAARKRAAKLKIAKEEKLLQYMMVSSISIRCLCFNKSCIYLAILHSASLSN